LLSTGGLAEVANALPKALRGRGHDVRVVMPCYHSIPEAGRGVTVGLVSAPMGGGTAFGALRESVLPGAGVPVYLIEHEGYFGRSRPYGDGATEYVDNAERFSFFCMAALDGIRQTGWRPDVVHCHDWHSAPTAIVLRTVLAADPFWQGVPVVFTIHNLAFQGRYDAARFAPTGLPGSLMSSGVMEFHGDMNLMKGAINYADCITTVSPRYAKEIQTLEYGEGLEGVLQARSHVLHGILNGVDYGVWHPSVDKHLPAQYTSKDLRGKAKCKAQLQARFGLPQRDVPVFGLVSRLYWQKGIDLLASVLEAAEELDIQVAMLGAGDPDMEARLRATAAHHPKKFALAVDFDAALAHQIQAGSDFFLMPSRYEPCGLSQLYSMAYGTIPIVRRTGGLADTVHDANPVYLKHNEATGLCFYPATFGGLLRAMERAVALYADKKAFAAVQQSGMHADFSWERACLAYETLYRELAPAA
jgi:starch synthase